MVFLELNSRDINFKYYHYICRMKKTQFILILFLFLGCSNNPDVNIICDTYLSEEKETLYFDGDYGDIETFFDFEIYKHRYNVEISFDRPIIDSYKGALRNLTYYIGETPPSLEDFYNLFLNDDQDLYLLHGVLETLKSRSIGADYDIIQMIVGFVQSIPYDEYAADVNYPYETLAFNKGDCDEKSILLCKLLNLEGYDACLFIYEKEQHMAVGLKVADSGYYKNGYVFIESTNTFPIGKRGKSKDGKESKEEPIIIYAKENSDGYYEQFLDIEECYKEITAIHGEFYLLNNIRGKNLIEKMNISDLQLDSVRQALNFLIEYEKESKSKIDSLDVILSKMNCSKVPSEDCNLSISERNLLIAPYNELLSDQKVVENRFNNLVSEKNKLVQALLQMNSEKSSNTRTIIDL